MVVYFEKAAHFHRTTCSYTIPSQQFMGTWTTRRALTALRQAMALTVSRHRGAVEIQRKQAACTKYQLPAAGLAMETLTIEGGTAITEIFSFTIKSEMIPSIMLKLYYSCCT